MNPILNDLAVQLAVMAAGVGAAGFLLRGAWRSARRLVHWGRRLAHQLDAMQDLLARELEPDHGSSMKDDVTAIARQLGYAQRRLDVLERRLRRTARTAADLHPERAAELLREDD